MIVLLIVLTLTNVSTFGADIYLAGDSTMCHYHEKQAPQQGWGNELQDLCKDGTNVFNHAIGGRSVKSFRNEKRWEKLVEELKEGDFVIIQFGHNDGNKNSEDRYANHRSEFRELLKACVDEVRAKKAYPILVGPTARWAFRDDDKNIHLGTIGAYAFAVKEVAEAEKAPFVDMTGIAVKKMLEMGPDESKKYYMSICKNDNLHLSTDGAKVYAKWFVEDVQRQKLPLARQFK